MEIQEVWNPQRNHSHGSLCTITKLQSTTKPWVQTGHLQQEKQTTLVFSFSLCYNSPKICLLLRNNRPRVHQPGFCELWSWRWYREKFLKLLVYLGRATRDTAGAEWPPEKKDIHLWKQGWVEWGIEGLCGVTCCDTLQGEANQAELLERLQHPYPFWYIKPLQ